MNERSETSPRDAAVAVRAVQDRRDLGHDRLVHRRDVAVAEREDRVEVHRRARARHLRADHQARGAGGEQVLGEDAHRARVRALALADEHDAVADRHDVAALERGAAPVVVDAAEPDLDAGVAEARMEAVDRLEVERLVLARGPEHRVDRHAAVDPRARVAHEQRVRERRQDEVGRPQRAPDRGRRCRPAARPASRRPSGASRAPRRASRSSTPSARRAKIVVTSSGRSLRCSSHSRAVASASVSVSRSWKSSTSTPRDAHQVDERVVLLARAARPDHVVEQQLVAVRRRQPLVREVRAVDDHAAQRLRPPRRRRVRVVVDGAATVFSSLSSGRPRRRRTRTTTTKAAATNGHTNFR